MEGCDRVSGRQSLRDPEPVPETQNRSSETPGTGTGAPDPLQKLTSPLSDFFFQFSVRNRTVTVSLCFTPDPFKLGLNCHFRSFLFDFVEFVFEVERV